jgi:hypothetical protein
LVLVAKHLAQPGVGVDDDAVDVNHDALEGRGGEHLQSLLQPREIGLFVDSHERGLEDTAQQLPSRALDWFRQREPELAPAMLQTKGRLLLGPGLLDAQRFEQDKGPR